MTFAKGSVGGGAKGQGGGGREWEQQAGPRRRGLPCVWLALPGSWETAELSSAFGPRGRGRLRGTWRLRFGSHTRV